MHRTFKTPRAAVAIASPQSQVRNSRLLLALAWLIVAAATASAVEPLATNERHPLYHRALPPGNVWKSPAATAVQMGTFQPVAFAGPTGTEFSLPQAGTLSEGDP